MVFNSFNFWLIFPFIFVLYWAIPSKFNRVRNGLLLLVSYLLYMNWKPSFAIVLLGVTLITWLGGQYLMVQKVQVVQMVQEVKNFAGVLHRLGFCLFWYSSITTS